MKERPCTPPACAQSAFPHEYRIKAAFLYEFANFIIEKRKVLFEINTAGAYRAKLKIRSKLLRLAKRVITADDAEMQ